MKLQEFVKKLLSTYDCPSQIDPEERKQTQNRKKRR